ncbi:type III pantothenate kinase [Sunxiuqinia elliptica]|uniref:Type III pantothenate kinase n=1 Tax=Sunxiuqinia elliptica TaxID=655355 RepID=A0A4R6H5P7_9BACT|nr:type III pantothenate kinase [Sunxiuqinia elliptica]TDO02796.1 type III pantothenate kinase [Sunxiuqinia elliptica]TDO58465.1 type III pantothenate kinase [Sunxiuqinia elliptica]
MQLAIDIGNTNIVLGLKAQDRWKHIWRIRTDARKTADEYEVIFRSLFGNAQVEIGAIQRAVLSSVVPSLNDDFQELFEGLLKLKVLVIEPGIYHRLPIRILNPYQIGTDLVANATAAFTKFDKPCMVVDFGTALTFLTLSGTGEILGVAIAPGLGTAVNSLAGNTAQLPHVQLSVPPSVLGRNTVHAIQSGVMIGYTGLVDRMIEQTEKELGEKLNVIATGGLSGIFNKESSRINHVEENLTLDGLMIIGEFIAQ